VGLSWGLLSTAKINGAILHAARETDEAEVVAVASRDGDRAQAYAREWGIPRAHGSYDALLEDPAVDAVYISLPNALHVEWAIRALEAGKHVLCEKPMDRRPEEVERAFDVAERTGLVLTEGFMWRHHPQGLRLAELVAEGAIGAVRAVRASFGFTMTREGDVRGIAALDGGSLMDVGCYCVSGARLFAGGDPVTVRAEQVLSPGGVDLRMAGLLRFPGDVLAHFDCGLDVAPNHHLEVLGETGSLFVADPWHCRAPGIELRSGGKVRRIGIPRIDPYRCELDDMAAAVRGEETVGGPGGRASGVARAPRLGREDAVGQARTIAALYRAAASGEPVAV
jgi:predicted dehydrogenase